jgi:flagellar basal-body rod protein FlgB
VRGNLQVGDINLFSLSSQYGRWLSVRQEAVSQNIANANTPGYNNIDVRPFSETLDRLPLDLVRTNPDHLSIGPSASMQVRTATGAKWDETISGNSVNLEQELMKAGEVNRAFALTTSLAKTFQHMYMTTVKS